MKSWWPRIVSKINPEKAWQFLLLENEHEELSGCCRPDVVKYSQINEKLLYSSQISGGVEMLNGWETFSRLSDYIERTRYERRRVAKPKKIGWGVQLSGRYHLDRRKWISGLSQSSGPFSSFNKWERTGPNWFWSKQKYCNLPNESSRGLNWVTTKM